MVDSFVEKYTQEKQAPRKKLLVLDDDHRQLDEHSKMMRELGYDVVPFLVKEGMTLGVIKRVMDSEKPDGVLTDWQMTETIDGLYIGEMIKHEAEMLELTPIPVVLHTGADRKWVQEKAESWKKECGLQGVFEKGLYKPIDAVFSAYFDAHPEVIHDRPGRKH